MTPVSRVEIAAYSILALPLAMILIPIFVHVPKLYGESLGVPIAWVGGILLLTRLLDAVQDPLIGLLGDRGRGKKF